MNLKYLMNAYLQDAICKGARRNPPVPAEAAVAGAKAQLNQLGTWDALKVLSKYQPADGVL